MAYPNHTIRYNFLGQDYVEIAIENYMEAKMLFNDAKTKKIKWMDFDRQNFDKKICVVITFCAMAVESFLNDYAAACLNDDKYYDSYDNLSIQSKFQLIVQFILKKEFRKDVEPYGLLHSLTKERNKLVHNKSRDYLEVEIGILEPLDTDGSTPKSFKDLNFDILSWLHDDFISATNALRAIIKLVNYFEENDINSNSCERMFEKYTDSFYKNEHICEELKMLIDLGLKVRKEKFSVLPF